jgi:hypothetical protein
MQPASGPTVAFAPTTDSLNATLAGAGASTCVRAPMAHLSARSCPSPTTSLTSPACLGSPTPRFCSRLFSKNRRSAARSSLSCSPNGTFDAWPCSQSRLFAKAASCSCVQRYRPASACSLVFGKVLVPSGGADAGAGAAGAGAAGAGAAGCACACACLRASSFCTRTRTACDKAQSVSAFHRARTRCFVVGYTSVARDLQFCVSPLLVAFRPAVSFGSCRDLRWFPSALNASGWACMHG